MIQNFKEEKMAELIKHLAGKFLAEEASPISLLTVTKVELYDRFRNGLIYFTVFPEEKESDALAFTKRKRLDFYEYVKNNSRMRMLPHFNFVIDKGEKSRQNIDRILGEAIPPKGEKEDKNEKIG